MVKDKKVLVLGVWSALLELHLICQRQVNDTVLYQIKKL